MDRLNLIFKKVSAKMLKLVCGDLSLRWAFKDNSQIYSNVVWLVDRNDAARYHLIDEKRNEVKVRVEDYIVDE